VMGRLQPLQLGLRHPVKWARQVAQGQECGAAGHNKGYG
jgi:hypothetical protein